MLITPQNLQTLFNSYKANFANAFAQYTPEWDKIATLIPSESETNVYAFLGNFPSLRKWLGDRHLKSVQAFGYQLTNDDFESTVEVSRNKIDDDTYGVYSPLFQEMGFAAARHPDEQIFSALAAGTTSLCYDGQYFFDTDHPVTANGVVGTKDNYDATTGTNTSFWCLLDTNRPLKPFIFQKRRDYAFNSIVDPKQDHVFMRNTYIYGVDARAAFGYGLWQLAYGSNNNISDVNVQAYYQKMMGLKSDEGKPLGVKPNLCVVGPSRWAEARALFLVPTLTGGAANPNFGLCEVLVTPYLT